MDTVKMRRDPAQYPAPHDVDVHPSMVADYRAGGFVEVEKPTEKAKETPQRGRPRKE